MIPLLSPQLELPPFFTNEPNSSKRRGGYTDEGPSPVNSASSIESPALACMSAASSATEGGDTASPATKRFQVPRACERCKRLRRGCSEYRPCRRCVDAGLRDRCMAGSSPQYALPPLSDASGVFQRLIELVPSRMLDYCTSRFFERLHPTIPILTPEYVVRLRSVVAYPDTGTESLCVLVAMCAQVLLQAEEPEELFHQGVITERNEAYGRVLLDAAMFAYQSLPRQSPLSIETCLLTFFLYTCEAALFHHSRAFRLLREATTLLVIYQPQGADDTVKLIHIRLFWVLLISERSHAIRYRRPVTLQITEDIQSLDSRDSSLAGFWSLAALFRPLDTSFIALLNNELLAMAPSRDGLNYIETTINSALKPGLNLHDTQKANLRVTQLWLRVIIWQLRLRLGFLAEESYQHSLTFRYPIEVAKDLMLSTRDLPIDSFKLHGMGLTEKLFDIASALVDVLARIPLASTSPRGLAMGSLPEDDLSYLRSLIRRLPGGNTIYDDLLEKHIQQAVPSLATRRLEMPQILSNST